MQKYADIAMLNGGAAEARRSFLSRRGRDGPGPAASRVSCLASRQTPSDERRETGDEKDFGLQTSDFQGKPLPTTH